MKILIASTPLAGHLNPLLAIGRMLTAEGHEVVALSSSVMRNRIEGIGAAFHPFPIGADLDLRDLDAAFPQRKTLQLGPETARFDLTRIFIDPIPAQHEGLQQVLRDFPADVIIGDNGFFGALPMLLGPRSDRPAIVLCGSTLLLSRRDDGAPHFLGLPLAINESQRQEYAAISREIETSVYEPVGRYLNDSLATFGVRALSMNIFDAVVNLPDAYLQLTVPSFEFPHSNLPPTVHFVGAVPIVPNQAPLPPWADELDGSRKVVLVTQGTVANFDFSQLVAPTLAALANEPDVLVVATAGGRDIDAIPGPIPANARLASYLPFEWLLPKVDAFITNGGYGSVNQALSFGVPIVGAGLSEDKADVSIRIAWSGVGINLATDEPTPSALREAIRTVLSESDYRSRASAMAQEFSRIDTRSEILQILEQVSGVSGKNRRVAGR